MFRQMAQKKRFVPYQGYQQGYVGQEEQPTDYPEHQPIGGSTRAYNPPHQMTAKIQPSSTWNADGADKGGGRMRCRTQFPNGHVDKVNDRTSRERSDDSTG